MLVELACNVAAAVVFTKTVADAVVVVLSVPVAVIEYVVFTFSGPTDNEPEVVTPTNPFVVILVAPVEDHISVVF
jgi:hypothetical protein